MYEICLNKTPGNHELIEMVRMFLPPSAFRIVSEEQFSEIQVENNHVRIRIPDTITDKNTGKRYLYDQLSKVTGKSPEWGILTGVRPVKLTGDMLDSGIPREEVKERLQTFYYLSERKTDLVLRVYDTQKETMKPQDHSKIAVYIGIPFCPTRCLYCSFPSYSIKEANTEAYLKALKKEIAFVGLKMQEIGWKPESLYIGGGTPTSLSSEDIDNLLSHVSEHLDLSKCIEFTVEAGRPDTITGEKLRVIRKGGADRISINPQSMIPETLERIGRKHSPEQIIEAFQLARNAGFKVINADLIAGLPGESLEEFSESLNEILKLSPENITVHTLSVKRGSQLAEIDQMYSYKQGELVGEMISHAALVLDQIGYRPYYLYRQKKMLGNLENVGYALPGTESVYNMKIMEENQTIIAMGAGGASKLVYHEKGRLDRIFNVSNYEIYIERIDEMILRKEVGIFGNREEIECQN